MFKTRDIISVISVVFFILLISGCNSMSAEYLPPKEFIKKTTMLQSASDVMYIGTGHKRIYLEQENYVTFGRVLGFSKEPSYTIFYTDIDKIPLDFFYKVEMKKINNK